AGGGQEADLVATGRVRHGAAVDVGAGHEVEVTHDARGARPVRRPADDRDLGAADGARSVADLAGDGGVARVGDVAVAARLRHADLGGRAHVAGAAGERAVAAAPPPGASLATGGADHVQLVLGRGGV